MKINETPIRTSKNYNINNFDVPDNTFDFQVKNTIKQNVAKQNYPLCEKSAKQLTKPNQALSYTFDNSTKERIVISNNLNKNNNTLISNISLVVKENAEANVLITLKSSTKAFANSFLKIDCEQNSKLNITILSSLKKSQNFMNIEATLHHNSSCNLNIVDFCNTLSVIKQTTDIIEDSAKFDINMLYLGTNNGAIDINIINNVFSPNNKTNINVVGALFDSAIKNFKGTIDFKKGAIKSAGQENELCLLFSNGAKSKALPILLSGEEDVDGSHSSATSKIDQKQLFYLMSRGLSKLDSMKLYLKAKFNSIITKLDKDVQKYINHQIDRELKKYE